MDGFVADVIAWFADPGNWTGLDGVPNRLWEHAQMSMLAMALATVLAVPAAVYMAHRRLGGSLVVAVVNIGRAIPSFAVVAVALPITIRMGLGLGFWPTLLALLFLAIPPLFSHAHAGISGVDEAFVDAGVGMGMTDRQVMMAVEVPLAMPIIAAGARIASVQVVATATLGALVAWGGLGRYIIDGFATQDLAEVFAGGVLVAILAILVEGLFSLWERLARRRRHVETRVRTSSDDRVR
jgi:osmoprotectant transport system permease protein